MATLPLENIANQATPATRKPRKPRSTEVAAVSQNAPAASQSGSPAPISDVQAMMAMIDRAARDPTVDMDKMDRLMAYRKDMLAELAEQAFNNAMAAAQAEMGPVRADSSNPTTKSRYASYGALDAALRPIYTKHGFALSFDTTDSPFPDHIRLICYVTAHGHTRKPHIDMPVDGKGAKGGDVMTKTHAVGSGVSYGQRYLLKMIFNIAVARDDDGNRAGQTEVPPVDPAVPKISQQQIDNLIDALEAKGAPRPGFLKWAQVARFEDIPADQYDGCIAGIMDFKPKAKK